MGNKGLKECKMKSKEEVVALIRKLFSLGNKDRNSSEAEAEAALQKAQELLQKHDLEMSEIIIDANKKELDILTKWLKNKTVNHDEAITLIDSTINPTISFIDIFPLPNSYTTPDIRIRDRANYPDFKRADKIVKKLDKDTDLVILSVRSENTKALKKALKGEKQQRVLIDDFKPDKHSLFKFIKDSTK